MKSLRDEICLWQMKSKQRLYEIKSTHPPQRRISSREAGFHREYDLTHPQGWI